MRPPWLGRRKVPGGGLAKAYRSGLESGLAAWLEARGVVVLFEKLKVPYTTPAKGHTYTPDFELPNGIIVETKGIFENADRAKHLLVQQQCPLLDIRFVFSNAYAPIYKGSPTTHAAWCEKYGFKWAHKELPPAWLEEEGPPVKPYVILRRPK